MNRRTLRASVVLLQRHCFTIDFMGWHFSSNIAAISKLPLCKCIRSLSVVLLLPNNRHSIFGFTPCDALSSSLQRSYSSKHVEIIADEASQNNSELGWCTGLYPNLNPKLPIDLRSPRSNRSMRPRANTISRIWGLGIKPKKSLLVFVYGAPTTMSPCSNSPLLPSSPKICPSILSSEQ